MEVFFGLFFHCLQILFFCLFVFYLEHGQKRKRHCDLPNSLISTHLPYYSPSECYSEWPKGTRKRTWCTFQVQNGSWNLRTLHKSGGWEGVPYACCQHWASNPRAGLNGAFPSSLSDLERDPEVPQEGPWGPAGSTFHCSTERKSECSSILFIFRKQNGDKDRQRGWNPDRH